MRLIAHRGNLTGPNPERENTEAYILEALKAGFDVEVDVWGEGVPSGGYAFMLGHDKPGSIVSGGLDFLSHPRIWKHAKNALALEALLKHKLHPFFFHDRDRYTLTSTGIPWIFPGEQYVEGGIMVFNGGERPDLDCSKFYGICSDNVAALTHLKESTEKLYLDIDLTEFKKRYPRIYEEHRLSKRKPIENLSFCGEPFDPKQMKFYSILIDKIDEIIDHINEKG
jgi:hypothetical protein